MDELEEVDDFLKHFRKEKSNFCNIVKNFELRRYDSAKYSNRQKRHFENFAEEEFIKKKDFEELRCEMPGVPRSTFLMVFSPDGTKVASTHGNHHIYVTDLRSGKHVKTLVGHPRTPWCIAFHPTSNQIVASGCLGGQVRIWDLSGGSEVWTTNTVIASVAFHPNDRVLVIATFNEVYFWDWSKPQPFCQTNTGNKKDKVRFVAFDKLGHKLITGISNSVSRWERSRCQIPQRNERAASPYRCRIIPMSYRFPARGMTQLPTTTVATTSTTATTNSEPLTQSSVPERERNIAMCYRNLVREYGRLVQRYLQLYRPPVMIDRGTDPMDISNKSTSGTQTPEPSSSGQQTINNTAPVPGCSTQELTSDGHKRKAKSSNDEKDHSKRKNAKVLPKTNSGNRTLPNPQNKSNNNSDDSQDTSDDEERTGSPKRLQDFDTTTVTNSTRLISSPSERASLAGVPGTSSTTANNTNVRNSFTQCKNNFGMELFYDTEANATERPIRSLSNTEANRTSEDTLQCDCVTNSDPTQTSTANNCFADIPKFIRSILCTHHARMSSKSTGDASSSTAAQNEGNAVVAPKSSTSSGSQTNLHNMGSCFGKTKTSKSDELRGKSLKKKSNVENVSSEKSLTKDNSTNNEDGPQPSTSNGRSEISPQPSTSSYDPGNEARSQVEKIISEMRNSTEEQIIIRVEQIMSSPLAQNTWGRNRQLVDLMRDVCQNALEGVRSKIWPIIEKAPESQRDELMRLFKNMEHTSNLRVRQLMLPALNNRKVNRRTTPDTSSETTSSEDDAELSGERYSSSRTEPLPQERQDRLDSSNAENSMLRTSSSSVIRLPSLQDYVYSMPRSSPRRAASITPPIPDIVRQTYHERNVMSGDIEQADSVENSTVNNLPPSTTTTNTAPILRSVYELSDSSDTTPTDTVQRRFVSTVNNPPGSTDRITVESDESPNQTRTNEAVPTTSSEMPNTLGNTNTRTTNSTIYTSSGINRRRSTAHSRSSAFQPTRMYYYPRTVLELRRNRYLGYGRWRINRPGRNSLSYASSNRNAFPPVTSSSNFANDEVINFADLPNSEDPDATTNEDTPMNFHPFDPPPNLQTINPENIGIGNMYSNIVQDLETSLNDVRNIRATNRPGEMSDMLSNFSDRLENIMNHSEAILRNLRSSMEMLPTAANPAEGQNTREANAIFNDPSFYVRDQRAAGDSATSTDHTYPRILESALGVDRVNASSSSTSSLNDTMSPLMASLHMTISHIQRQASLLRRQVESIERIDRAMVEVAQLQLIRLLLVELTRYIRNMSGENRSTCMSSVRQMMAGTRISDSSPGESQAEENSQSLPSTSGVLAQSQTTSSTTTSSDASSAPTRQPRSAGRKTYPPSRLSRFQRTTLLHYMPRRYGLRQTQNRLGVPQTSRFSSSNINFMEGLIFSRVNTLTLNRMLRRLEELIIEQVDSYICNVTPHPVSRLPAGQLDEQNLANRLLRSVTTANRLVGNVFDTNIWRNYRIDTASVARGGVDRFLARQTLTYIIDGISRYLDDNRNSTVPVNFRTCMQGVMTMAMLVSELLLLQIVESIPPPTGMNLDQERSSLISRVNQMCNMMLVSRFMGYSSQLVSRLHRCSMQTYLRMHQTQSTASNLRPTNRPVFARRIRNTLGSERTSHRVQVLGRIGRSLRSLDTRLSNELTRLPAELTRHRAERRRLSEEDDSNESDSRSQSERRPNRYLTVPSWIPTTDQSNIPTTTDNAASEDTNRQFSSLGNLMNNIERPAGTCLRSSTLLRSLNTASSSTASTNTPSTSGSSSNFDESNRRSWPNLWNVPTVQVNDIPLSEFIQQAENTALSSISPANHTFQEDTEISSITQAPEQQPPEQESNSTFNPNMAMIAAIRAANQTLGAFRPRFLHPLYAGVNPFDADLDDPQRENIYDSDVITTATPNHRIQVWDISSGDVPTISNPTKNIVVAECKIHNDASVDIASDGSILVSLLPSGGYLNVTNRLGVYSLRWENLGQCLYTTSFDYNAVSVSLSPLAGYLVVGLANRQRGCIITPSDRLMMARIFKIEKKDEPGDRLPLVRELDQARDVRANNNHKNINCIRWLPTSGQGLIYGTNTGQLALWT